MSQKLQHWLPELLNWFTGPFHSGVGFVSGRDAQPPLEWAQFEHATRQTHFAQSPYLLSGAGGYLICKWSSSSCTALTL